jgi:hypothetical protein
VSNSAREDHVDPAFGSNTPFKGNHVAAKDRDRQQKLVAETSHVSIVTVGAEKEDVRDSSFDAGSTTSSIPGYSAPGSESGRVGASGTLTLPRSSTLLTKLSLGPIDYRCDNRRFWLSAHNCQVRTPASQNLELAQQIRIFGAD